MNLPLALGKPLENFQHCLGTFAKLQEVSISFVMSVHPCVCPHGTTRLPLDGFS
jgi:hypothetical protein